MEFIILLDALLQDYYRLFLAENGMLRVYPILDALSQPSLSPDLAINSLFAKFSSYIDMFPLFCCHPFINLSLYNQPLPCLCSMKFLCWTLVLFAWSFDSMPNGIFSLSNPQTLKTQNIYDTYRSAHCWAYWISYCEIYSRDPSRVAKGSFQ